MTDSKNIEAMCERLRLPLMYDTNILAVTANINIANRDRQQAATLIERLTAERDALKLIVDARNLQIEQLQNRASKTVDL